MNSQQNYAHLQPAQQSPGNRSEDHFLDIAEKCLASACHSANELSARISGLADRIIGAQPTGVADSAPTPQPHSALARLDQSISTLQRLLNSASSEFERLERL